MVITEKSFPRGGIVRDKPKEPKIHFGAVTIKKPKKDKLNKRQREAIRQTKQNAAVTKPKAIEAFSAELLSFRSIKEGMIILGCVRKINATSLEIALPGRMNGTVEVSAISETYLKLAEHFVQNETNEVATDNESDNEYQPLLKLFQIGQMVCVKVLQIDTSKTNKIGIQLSMNPKDVHADFHHGSIQIHMPMSVAIAERQEHGYVIETGVKNLRGFLPMNAATANLIVGSVHFCCVDSIMVSPTASTATFRLYGDGPNQKQATEPDANYILPGTLVKFSVNKIMKDGLQGTIFGDSLVGYVNEHQLGFAAKQPKQPKDFSIGDKQWARVLYVMPLTKIVYLSFNAPKIYLVEPTSEVRGNASNILPTGKIIEKAIVSHIGTGGIILKFANAKGIISLRSLKGQVKANFDFETILAKYQKDSEHKVRILHYDPIDFLHVCSVDKKIVEEKFFTVDDVKTGDFVSAKIKRKLNDGRYEIKVGEIKGFIHPSYLSKKTSAKKLEENSMLKCRVVCKNLPKNEIFVTNLKEFMDENAPILTMATNIMIETIFIGVVKKRLSDGWLIGFFDYLTGMIYRNQLTTSELSTAERFYDGQVLRVAIKHVRDENDKKHITLGLADFLTDIGTVHSGKVAAIQPTGIDAAFLSANLNGFVPIMYLSNYPNLVHALHRSYQCNDDIEAIGVAQNCYSVRDMIDFNGDKTIVKKMSELEVGDVIPAFVKSVKNDVIDVQLLLKDLKSTVPIHLKMFLENEQKAEDVTLVPDQKIFVKICAVNSTLKTVTCSARLHDVWSFKFKDTALMMRQYFNDLNKIKNSLSAKKTVRNYSIGQIVSGKFKDMDQIGLNGKPMRTFLLDDGIKVYVTHKNDAYNKKSKMHQMIIVWIDYANNVMYGTMLKKYFDRLEIKQNEEAAAEQLIAHPGMKANVLLILDDLIIVYPTKLTNQFIFIPKRFHLNDFHPIISKGINEGEQVNISMIDIGGDQFIGMIHNFYQLYDMKVKQTVLIRKSDEIDAPVTPKKKRKHQQSESNAVVEIVEVDESVTEKKTPNKSAKKQKKIPATIECVEEPTSTPVKKQQGKSPASNKKAVKRVAEAVSPKETVTPSKKEKKSPAKKKTPAKFSMKSAQLDGAMDLNDSDSDEDDSKPTLPGVSNFWSTDLNALNATKNASSSESSSEDEDDSSANKKKLSSKERFQAARNEEARIRKIEQSLADDSILPTSIDQFDRLVMAEPNNSRAWINYMVFHVQATEIDRARAIAQKALKTIDVREQQERLNIWIAMLNMELRYGSKDAFDDILKEALLVNEPFKVYSVCLKIFADCKRLQELNDMVLTVTKKFRQNPECWLNAAQALFEVDLADKAKPLLNRALNSLPEREHINTISRFANLCNKYGDKDHAHALYEQIVVSYPKRVDCWSQYIDVLIKGNDIDLARQALERAVTHKIPVKKMRTLFKKYLEFEQKYGNDESVTKVKMMAANFVHNEINA